jgi:hypothetical protein
VQCRRFWVPRGNDPDLSDDGYLVDPDADRPGESSAVPFDFIATHPVLVLLGEPGIGKTTAIASYRDQVAGAIINPREDVWFVDLSLYGSDALLDRRVFRSSRSKQLKGADKAQIFFDGFDECLLRIPNLPGLLLEFLSGFPHTRMLLRIASRSADWSAELESGLRQVWGEFSWRVRIIATP